MRCDAHLLFNTLADTLSEVEVVTLGDIRSHSQALVDSLADTLAELEAMALGDTWAMRTNWSTFWLTS